MTGFADVRESLTERFARFALNYDSSLPVFYDNQRFANPLTGPWVYFAFIPNQYYRADLGGAKVLYRADGVFNIACMAPQNDGTKSLYELIDGIVLDMNDKAIRTEDGSIYTDRSVIKNRGVIEGWHTVNVQGEFRYDFGIQGVIKNFPDTDLDSLLFRAATATFTVAHYPFLGDSE